MSLQPIVALDLGATKVACAIGQLQESGNGVELLGSSVAAYPRPFESWLSDPLTVASTIEQALEASGSAGDRHRALVTFHHAALASERVQAAIELADEPVVIRAQDLGRLTARALDLALPVDREPLVLERLACAGNGFDAVRDPQGLSATRLLGTFYLVTMPIAVRRAIVQAVESAGLEVMQLTLGVVAMMASLGAGRSRHQRVVLIDLGGVSSDVALFVDGHLHALRTIPWGGVALASDVAKTCHVTLDQALTLSLEGLASRRPDVRELVQRELGALAQAIGALLRDEPRPDHVFIGGRAALIDGAVEWLEQATQLPMTLARSPQTQHASDLGRQLALSPVLGLLALAGEGTPGAPRRAPHRVGRLIDRTRALLTEYF